MEHVLCFILGAPDRPGLLGKVVEVVRQHDVDIRRLHAVPSEAGRCLFVVSVGVDCALRFGSLLHRVRYCAKPLLLQRVPTELGTAKGHDCGSEPLRQWLHEAPGALVGAPVVKWKLEALRLAAGSPEPEELPTSKQGVTPTVLPSVSSPGPALVVGLA